MSQKLEAVVYCPKCGRDIFVDGDRVMNLQKVWNFLFILAIVFLFFYSLVLFIDSETKVLVLENKIDSFKSYGTKESLEVNEMIINQIKQHEKRYHE